MKIPVKTIEVTGVSNLLFIRLMKSGNKLSLLRAIGYLEAAIIPARAVVTKANIAAMLMAR